MKLSDKTDELFKAFAKFQGELENASKDKQGHGYKYADLAECINTAKPHLKNNGLAVSQMLGASENGAQTLITMLTHESGQYIASEFVMVDAKLMGGAGNNPAQVLGSAITYQRRYAYAAIIGLAQEDDDAAQVKGKKQTQATKMNAEQIAQVTKEIEAKGFTAEQVCETWNIKSLADIDPRNLNETIKNIRSWN